MLLMLVSRQVTILSNLSVGIEVPQIRPTAEELKEMGPEFNELWDRYFKDKPDKPVMVCQPSSYEYVLFD